MKFPDIKVDDLKSLVFTTIDLVVKPFEALTITNNEVLSKHNTSAFSYWFWTTLFSVLVTVLGSMLVNTEAGNKILASSTIIFLYSLIRIIWVAILYYFVLLFFVKLKYISNSFHTNFFGAFLFSTGLTTLLVSIALLPVMAKHNLIDMYLNNISIEKIEITKDLKTMFLIYILIGLSSYIFFSIYAYSLTKNELTKTKVIVIVMTLILCYLTTKPIITKISNETRFFVAKILSTNTDQQTNKQ